MYSYQHNFFKSSCFAFFEVQQIAGAVFPLCFFKVIDTLNSCGNKALKDSDCSFGFFKIRYKQNLPHQTTRKGYYPFSLRSFISKKPIAETGRNTQWHSTHGFPKQAGFLAS